MIVKKNKLLKIPYWPQWLAASEVFLLAVMAGTTTGWLVMFLGKLAGENPPFQVTKEQTTWIASILFLSRPIGTLIGVIKANYYGSKSSLYTAGFNFIIAWIILIFANNIYLVLLSLVFCGVGMGNYSCVYPIFVSEIADRKIRGALCSLVMHGHVVGILIGNLMGTHLDTWVFAAINLGPSTVYLITFYFFPHTPYHLVHYNKIAEAEKSIRFYTRKNVKNELESLTKFLEENPRLSTLEALRRLNTPVNRKVTFIVNFLYCAIQFSGVFAIMDYLQIIFVDAKVDLIQPATLVTLMSVSSIPACWVAICTADRFGRTTLLSGTCFVFFVSLLCWGLNFHLLHLGYNIFEMQYLVICCAFFYRTSINIGIIPIIPTIMGELYAPDVKIVGCCIGNITSALCIFISSKNFRFMVDYIGYHFVFYIFAVIVLLMGIYTKTCVPETKGKSLQEIQEMLSNQIKEGVDRKRKQIENKNIA